MKHGRMLIFLMIATVAQAEPHSPEFWRYLSKYPGM